MKAVALVGATVACMLACQLSARPPQGAVTDSAGVEARWERQFRSIPDPAHLREHMRHLSARPHHVGSPYDKANAEWILARFKEWGLDAHIETFEVLFPSPRERSVELVSPGHFVASLREPPIEGDSTSLQTSEQIPTYNAYSADGDVRGPLVYANYGVPGDYEQLERMGISVKGAVVLARYGASWRGIKPKVAAEHGAIACLLYSDPRGDGFYQGDPYPAGPWRPADGVQRGSVVDMTLYPGDPQTPGIASTHDAKRLPLTEVKVLTKIPVLPISSADAAPLLAALRGPVAPDHWRGSLGATYHIGPGPAVVHVVVRANWDIKTIYDVIGTIKGTQYPDEWVVRGNHHDAWVNGAEDPLSGQSALLEEARAFGGLLKAGWRPRRTIVYCAWDGEEPGLLGSTEWAEAHADALHEHAVAYINSDSNDRGYLFVSGSHSLEAFINDVARDIQDPETRTTVWKRAQLRTILDAADAKARREARERKDLRISAPGSGSDYTAFLDHLGIASLNLGFGGEGGNGVYHSIYDDFAWYTRYADTAFVYGRALAQTGGTAVLRLADAELLPFDFSDLAETLRSYLDDLQSLSRDMRDAVTEKNRELDEGVFTATADPWEISVPPRAEAVPPRLNFSPVLNASDRLSESAERYARARERYLAGPRGRAGRVNGLLIESERRLTSAEGLPLRPWFKHMIYAPGLYTGYEVKTIPSVREAIEQKQWSEADRQIERVAKIFDNEAALIDSAASALNESAVQER